MFISYAQNFEDVMLWRALKHVENGFYIDIGAQDPITDSVSKAFYEHGWRGVNVEPTHYYASKLRQERPDETVIQAAIGNGIGTIDFFEVIDTGLSTGNKQIADQHRVAGFTVREVVVPCLPLSDLLERYQDREIHWLKIDVEGMEKVVLEGWGSSEVRPWIVVVESTLPNTQVETHQQWEHLLNNIGYEFAYFDGLSRFYVSNGHLELKDYFRYPPNVFDNFAFNGTSGTYCLLLNNKLSQYVHEFNIQIEKIELENKELRSALNDRDSIVGEYHSKVEQLIDKHAEQEREITLLQAQSQQLIEEREVYTGQKAEVAVLQTQIQHLLDHLKKRDREIGGLQVRYELLTNDWNVAKLKIDELNSQSNHWWMVADGLNHELQAVYSSHSWRLTKPLRLIRLQLKRLLVNLKSIVARVSRVPKWFARKFLETALIYVRQSPKFKVWLKRILTRWPSLQGCLYKFASTRLSIPEVSDLPLPSTSHNSNLTMSNCTESVRNVYLQLTLAQSRARQRTGKEGQV